ncbi:MAG: hypothetical protein IK141_01775, partial [Clostridia bacterium]|nr:hypothetical protein [Clostridia bacterium]
MNDQKNKTRFQEPSNRGGADTKAFRSPVFQGFSVYVWACLAGMFAVQMLAFYATRLFLPYLTLHDMSIPLDGRIPFVPQWVVVYFLAFALWLASTLWILSESKERGYRFACGYILALLMS